LLINQKPKENAFRISNHGSSALIYTTSKNSTERLSESKGLHFRPIAQASELEANIIINPDISFQTVTGIGGAITDAAAETFYKLPLQKQEELATAYFDSNNGIGYSLIRTNMNSCDFSSQSYTYVNDSDTTLSSFDIAPDLRYKIPFIKKAISTAKENIKFYASPWSPPAWMKTNNNMLRGGKLLPRYNQLWANYYTKFIKAYEQQGIPAWGLSVQNEPLATQTWESCIFTATEERDFIKNFLGPTLKKENLDDKKLIGWDHNRDLIFDRANILLNDPEAAKYIWGIGYHWYETWTGSEMQFENVKRVNEAFPKTNLIFTEGCVEKFDINRTSDWSLGERYGYSIINDFNSGAVAWTDWNILLDENGGPNHVSNFCFAPVHADTKSGDLIYTNSYYYLGHFSKFIRPEAKRIASSSTRSQLLTTAFINENGKTVIVVMNKQDKDITYNLCISSNAAQLISKANSIVTIVL
jgi:glucosylceramidase